MSKVPPSHSVQHNENAIRPWKEKWRGCASLDTDHPGPRRDSEDGVVFLFKVARPCPTTEKKNVKP